MNGYRHCHFIHVDSLTLPAHFYHHFITVAIGSDLVISYYVIISLYLVIIIVMFDGDI